MYLTELPRRIARWALLPLMAGALLAQDASVTVLLEKARALEGRGRIDLAAQTWQQVLLMNPNQPDALAGLARQAKQDGKAEAAAGYLERLRRVSPDNVAILQLEATEALVRQKPRLEEAARLARANQLSAALAIYREVFRNEPPPGIWAITYYETEAGVPDGWEPATRGLQKLLNQYPAADEYKLSLGRLWTYRPETRVQGIRLLEKIRPNGALAAQAREVWRQALVWEGQKPSNAAEIRAYLTRYPDAELQESLSQIPVVQPVKRGLVQTKEEQQGFDALNAKNLTEAESRFDAVLKASPRSVGALAGMAYIRMEQKNFHAALEYFEAAKAGDPDSKELVEGMEAAGFWNEMSEGTRALESQMMAEAESHYRAALARRPNSVEAMQGLAGTLLRVGKAAEAASQFEMLTRVDPKQATAWQMLVVARHRSSGGKSAIEASNSIPPAVQVDLSRNIEFLGVLVAAHSDTGNTEEAARIMAEAIEVSAVEKKELPADVKLQFGGLSLRLNRPSQAQEFYQAVVDADPSRAVAWQGLAASLSRQGKDTEAYQALQRMPKPLFEQSLKDFGFLRLAAAIEAKFGRLDVAEELVLRVLDAEAADPQLSTQVQLAGIWLKQGQPAKAERMLFQLSEKYPTEPEVWKMLLAVLSENKKNEQAAAVINRIPPPLMVKLLEDPAFVTAVASVRSAGGGHREALEMVQAVVRRLELDKEPVPVDIGLQYAWLLYNARGDENELYRTLTLLTDESNRTEAQKKDTQEVWSLWTRRRAQDSRETGDFRRAVTILAAAARLLPEDARITSALAGTHLQSGDAARAVQIYKSWGFSNAAVYDYTSAAAAAMIQKDPVASKWIDEGLQKYPRDPDILNVAGKLAAQKGDYKRAEQFWELAAAALQLQERVNQSPAKEPARALQPALGLEAPSSDPARSLGNLLLNGRAPEESAEKPGAGVPNKPADKEPKPIDRKPTIGAIWREAPMARPRVVLAAFVPQAGRGESSPPAPRSRQEPQSPEQALSPNAPAEPVSDLAPTSAVTSVKQQELEDQINAVRSRNTFYVGMGMEMSARSGRKGFEERILQEAEMKASAVFADRWRATIVARPTYLSTGASDGSSDLRLGLAPRGTSLAEVNVAGVAGEAQLSSNTFGLNVGISPQGFLVRNIIGGVRFRPASGPITLRLTREPVKDSMLSFAGVKDPVIGTIFGGVIADGLGAEANWGDDKAGFYASGGYQRITGRNVERNSQKNAGAGAYWRMLALPGGFLQAGFNLFGMNYDKNLRFFTLGQGGYFSPQRYVLMGVPLTWKGARNRLEYVASGSVGVQYFREDASPYFPGQTAFQNASRLSYSSQAITGANFNLDVRLMYRISPNWGVMGFVNSNNTRNFTNQSAGFSLIHTARPAPMDVTTSAPSVPDWRGAQPLRVQ